MGNCVSGGTSHQNQIETIRSHPPTPLSASSGKRSNYAAAAALSTRQGGGIGNERENGSTPIVATTSAEATIPSAEATTTTTTSTSSSTGAAIPITNLKLATGPGAASNEHDHSTMLAQQQSRQIEALLKQNELLSAHVTRLATSSYDTATAAATAAATVTAAASQKCANQDDVISANAVVSTYKERNSVLEAQLQDLLQQMQRNQAAHEQTQLQLNQQLEESRKAAQIAANDALQRSKQVAVEAQTEARLAKQAEAEMTSKLTVDEKRDKVVRKMQEAHDTKLSMLRKQFDASKHHNGLLEMQLSSAQAACKTHEIVVQQLNSQIQQLNDTNAKLWEQVRRLQEQMLEMHNTGMTVAATVTAATATAAASDTTSSAMPNRGFSAGIRRPSLSPTRSNHKRMLSPGAGSASEDTQSVCSSVAFAVHNNYRQQQQQQLQEQEQQQQQQQQLQQRTDQTKLQQAILPDRFTAAMTAATLILPHPAPRPPSSIGIGEIVPSTTGGDRDSPRSAWGTRPPSIHPDVKDATAGQVPMSSVQEFDSSIISMHAAQLSPSLETMDLEYNAAAVQRRRILDHLRDSESLALITTPSETDLSPQEPGIGSGGQPSSTTQNVQEAVQLAQKKRQDFLQYLASQEA
jgi:hypothetical protein